MNTRLAPLVASGILLFTGCTFGGEKIPDASGGDTQADAVISDVMLDTEPGDIAVDLSDADGSDAAPDADVAVSPWKLRSLGDAGVLRGIFARSTTEAYGVGASRVIRYNGAYWATYGDIEGAQLHGVWASDEGVVVVGEGGTIARRGSGEFTWTLDEVPTNSDLYGVYGRASDDIWAVGDKTTILHFDGSTWKEKFKGSTTVLNAVWVRPGSEGNAGIWAVGTNGRLVRYSGGSWVTEQITVSAVTLNDIWGSGEALFTVGTGGTISMRPNDQSVWKGQASNDPNQRDLTGIAGYSESELYVVGDGGTIIEFDGNKWNIQPIVGPNGVAASLVGAAYLPSGQQGAWFAVASNGGGLQLADEGWVDMTTKPQVDVREMDGSDAGGTWIVGAKGLVLTETETGWTSLDSGTEFDLNAVEVTDDGHVWAVGEDGHVVHWSPDGTQTQADVGVPVTLNGVAVGPDAVYVCGKGGTLMKSALDEIQFSPILSGTPSDIHSCAWGGDGNLWLAGSFGTLITLPGGEDATPVTSGVGETLNAIAATAEGVIIVGDNGVALKASVDSVEQLTFDEGVVAGGIGLYGISHHNGLTYTVGWKGAIFSTDSNVLTEELSPTSAVLEAVWHDGTRAVAAGRQGVLLEKTEAE